MWASYGAGGVKNDGALWDSGGVWLLHSPECTCHGIWGHLTAGSQQILVRCSPWTVRVEWCAARVGRLSLQQAEALECIQSFE